MGRGGTRKVTVVGIKIVLCENRLAVLHRHFHGRMGGSDSVDRGDPGSPKPTTPHDFFVRDPCPLDHDRAIYFHRALFEKNDQRPPASDNRGHCFRDGGDFSFGGFWGLKPPIRASNALKNGGEGGIGTRASRSQGIAPYGTPVDSRENSRFAQSARRGEGPLRTPYETRGLSPHPSCFALPNPFPRIRILGYFGFCFAKMAEREGFEPSKRFWHLHAFQACSLNHSDTSPRTYCRFYLARRAPGRNESPVIILFFKEHFVPAPTGRKPLGRLSTNLLPVLSR